MTHVPDAPRCEVCAARILDDEGVDGHWCPLCAPSTADMSLRRRAWRAHEVGRWIVSECDRVAANRDPRAIDWLMHTRSQAEAQRKHALFLLNVIWSLEEVQP